MNFEEDLNEKSDNLTRLKLAKLIEERVGGTLKLPRPRYLEFVDAFFDEICRSLIQGEDVKIVSFGSFLIKRKKERLGRNPKTKQAALISARKIIKFRASKHLIRRINSLQHTQKYQSVYNQFI